MALDTIGSRMKWWRRTNTTFKTPSEAARAIQESQGIASQTYLGHENDSHLPRRSTAMKYASFYRINLHWLLTGSGKPRANEGFQREFDSLPPEGQAEAQAHMAYLKVKYSDSSAS